MVEYMRRVGKFGFRIDSQYQSLLESFLDATTDSVRLVRASKASREILHEYDMDEMEDLRSAVQASELLRVIPYPRQTDHSAHTLYLYLLGIYLFFACAPLRARIAEFLNEEDKSPTLVARFLFQWAFASLLHDIGYIFHGRSKNELRAVDRMFRPSTITRLMGLGHESLKQAVNKLRVIGTFGEPGHNRGKSRYHKRIMTLELHTLMTKLLPPTRGIRLVEVAVEEASVQVQLMAIAPTASCPDCTMPSSSIHRRYQRRLADLPWGSRAIHIQADRTEVRVPTYRLPAPQLHRAPAGPRRHVRAPNPPAHHGSAGDRPRPRRTGGCPARGPPAAADQCVHPPPARASGPYTTYPSPAGHWGRRVGLATGPSLWHHPG
jgi:hypothetical protein